MTQATYIVRVKNQSGAKVAEFVGRGRRVETGGGMQSLTYRKRLNTSGGYTLRIDGLDDRIALLDLDISGTLDAQIEFWRRDLLGGTAYTNWLATLPLYQRDSNMPDWYKDFECFHRAMEFDQDKEGHDVFVSYGRGYNDLLLAETIRYPVDSSYTNKNAPAETVIKEFVNENIGPGATSPPRDRNGVMPGLTIEANTATGATWQGDRANKNLLSVCQELADYGPGDYGIIGTGAATFEFQWKYPFWGRDKRLGNSAGNPPAVFSSQYGTASDIKYSYSRLDEINTVDVLGVGKSSNNDRVIVTTTSGFENDSPWAVRSVVREDSGNFDITILTDKGQQALNEQKLKRVFSFRALQTTGFRYGRDWDLGDIVTLVFRDRQVHQKIVGIFVTLDKNGNETIQPECEDFTE